MGDIEIYGYAFISSHQELDLKNIESKEDDPQKREEWSILEEFEILKRKSIVFQTLERTLDNVDS